MTLSQALSDGLRQVDKNDYAAELRASGVEKIHEMVVAFDGKRVKVLPKGAKVPQRKKAAKKAASKARAKR
ncbi:MAG TPA: hypothetical protein PK156_19175 [Polyangium sp.]|nr:hypothetical protein [Polyangium sp.]